MNRIQFNLEGTTTVITGGSSGIGLATAELIARSGGHVIVSESRQVEKTQAALARIHDARAQETDIFAFPYDGANEASVKAFFEKVAETGKRVDYLVHSAAVSPDTPFDDQTAILWNKVLSTNTTGTFLAAKYAREVMKKQEVIDEVRGKILLITSTNGIDSYGIFSAPYDASKAATNNMVRNMGESFHVEDKITVNGIAPGWIDTELNNTLPPDEKEKETKKIWAGRFATPAELATNIVAMLTLPYKSGRVDMIDGGYR